MVERLFCSCGRELEAAPGSTVKCSCGRSTTVPVQTSPSDSVPAPLTGDKESRFGAIAVRLGLVKAQELLRAVGEQAAAQAQGRRIRLGEVLVQKGWIRADDAQKILDLQSKQIFPCAKCGRRYNVAHLPKGGRIECRLCQTSIAVPDYTGDLRADETVYVSGPAAEPAIPPPSLPAELRDMVPGYRIERILGKGGIGTVYLATQLSLSRPVAIKLLAPKFSSDPSYIERFLNEAKSIGGLQHENVIRAIDRGLAGTNKYFLVMEYADGETIADRIKRDGAIPERESVALARQVAEGLKYALENGFLHRDVKPANLILTREGRVKICDLGISKPVDGQPQGGPVLCSPLYAPPEVIRGREADHRSDLYSLGATLYEMLTGQPPFTGPDRATVLRKQVQEAPVPPRQINAALSDGVQRIVLKMIAKDPQQRHGTYDELIAELEALVNAKPSGHAPAVQPSPTRIGGHLGRRKFARFLKRGTNPMVPVGFVVLAVVVVFVILTVRRGSTPPADKGTKPVAERKSGSGHPGEPEISEETRAKAELLVWQINLSALAAAFCDRLARVGEARELLEAIVRHDKELRALGVELPEYARPGDELRTFQGLDLKKAGSDASAREIGKFLRSFKAGSRVRVSVLRKGTLVDFEMVFDQRPKELAEIARVADQ